VGVKIDTKTWGNSHPYSNRGGFSRTCYLLDAGVQEEVSR
jgi:hypothetical protein